MADGEGREMKNCIDGKSKCREPANRNWCRNSSACKRRIPWGMITIVATAWITFDVSCSNSRWQKQTFPIRFDMCPEYIDNWALDEIETCKERNDELE